MFTLNGLLKFDIISELKRNQFLVSHYLKIKVLVYVFLLCYVVTENSDLFLDSRVSFNSVPICVFVLTLIIIFNGILW